MSIAAFASLPPPGAEEWSGEGVAWNRAAESGVRPEVGRRSLLDLCPVRGLCPRIPHGSLKDRSSIYGRKQGLQTTWLKPGTKEPKD